MDEFLEVIWNWLLKVLKLTNSQDMIFAKPMTESLNGLRQGEGVKFVAYINRHVSNFLSIPYVFFCCAILCARNKLGNIPSH